MAEGGSGFGRWLTAGVALAVAAVVVGGLLVSRTGRSGGPADPGDAEQVALGQTVYERHCASCHGVDLQGQPNWQRRRADGRLPAPPQDASGHTWHHPDRMLFAMIRDGVAAQAGPGYQSDMPAFAGLLEEREIWAVLAYIKSRWPAEIRRRQAEIDRRSRH